MTLQYVIYPRSDQTYILHTQIDIYICVCVNRFDCVLHAHMPRNIKAVSSQADQNPCPIQEELEEKRATVSLAGLMLQSAKPWKSLTIRSSRPALCDSSARCGFQLQGKFNGTYFGSTRMKRCTKPVGKQSQMIFPSGMTQGHAMTQLRNMPSIECVCVFSQWKAIGDPQRIPNLFAWPEDLRSLCWQTHILSFE